MRSCWATRTREAVLVRVVRGARLEAAKAATVTEEICMKLIMAVATVAFTTALAGCNTFEGFGRDVERGGEKLQDSSLKVRADWRAARDSHETEYETARRSCSSGTEADRDACRDRARGQYSASMNESRSTYRRTRCGAFPKKNAGKMLTRRLVTSATACVPRRRIVASRMQAACTTADPWSDQAM